MSSPHPEGCNFACHAQTIGMCLSKILPLVLFVGLVSAAHAAKTTNGIKPTFHVYPVQRISVTGIKDIQIVGVKGQVSLRGRKTRSLALKVKHSAAQKFEDWQLSVDRRDDTLYLEVINLVYGKAWRQQVKADLWPEFDIELEGPSLPTRVSWREGDLRFDQWNSSLDIGFLKGQVEVTGGQGSVTVEPLEANVKVSNRVGAVKVHGESGNLDFSNIRGALQVNWLKGKVAANRCTGSVQIESNEGSVHVRGGRGRLSVNLAEGNADIREFSGTILAKGEESSWKLKARAPTDISVSSQSGGVDVDWRGGARVFLTTTDGQLLKNPPLYMREQEDDGHRALSGTKLGKARGEVFVRTRSGAIFWRESDSQ